MHGSLALRGGVLWVARHELSAHVRPFDLDGRALGPGFSVQAPEGRAARVDGLAADADHLLWIADGAADRVVARSAFGRSSGGFGSAPGPAYPDRPGRLARVRDVALLEDGDDYDLLVTSGGARRHALQIFTPAGELVHSLRPEGDAEGHFRGLTRAAAREGLVVACEREAGRVQVFRDGHHHFSFRLAVQGGARFEPVAAALLDGGRLVLACAGEAPALLLCDAAGRLVRVLADGSEGAVRHPQAVVSGGEGAGEARVVLMDRDGERVQVFTLAGRCYGALTDLPGSAHSTGPP